MEGFTYVDIYETNSLEFLLVIVFLIVVAGFWKFLMGKG